MVYYINMYCEATFIDLNQHGVSPRYDMLMPSVFKLNYITPVGNNMEIDFSEIIYLQDPNWQDLSADYEQFLLSMTGPTVIDITGLDPQKCRVVTTLLQGSEPSGLIALHRWLTTRDVNELPRTNLRFIICSVEAACIKPLLSKRFIEGSKDINRCFGNVSPAQHKSQEQNGCYERAQLIKRAIQEVSPEVVIDLHNAASPCPTFAVSSVITPDTISVASLFCQTLILSGLQLGSLVEQKFSCPTITIECGGRIDEQAHEVAYAGISHLAKCEKLDSIQQEKNIEIISLPLRLKLKEDVNLSYASHDEGHSGVTLKQNIDCFNFGGANQDEMIGWVDGNGLDNLQLFNKHGCDVVSEYFYIRENQLVCKQNLRLFKATSDKQVALADCLFYVVKQTPNRI